MAQVWHDAGCAVHPAKADGSKVPQPVAGGSQNTQPDVFPDTLPNGRPHPHAGRPNPQAGRYGWGWKRIADGGMDRLTVEQLADVIMSGQADGIGVFCGPASGHMEMVELEGRALHLLTPLRAAAERLGATDLLARLESGCVEESPSGGLH